MDEAGSIGGTPAIVAAVVDALAPLSMRHLDMPIKPENVWRIINKKPAVAGSASRSQRIFRLSCRQEPVR